MTAQRSPLPIRIFLAAPDDVADERELALKVIERLADDPALRDRVTVEAITWQEPGTGASWLTPHEAQDYGLPKPSACDIVVVILWEQMGDPLPADYTRPDSTPSASILDWLYQDAHLAARRTGMPLNMVYRRTAESPLDPTDPAFMQKREERRQVEAFFAAFHNPDGSLRDNYNTYQTRRAFQEHFARHLKILVELLLDAPPLPPEVFEEEDTLPRTKKPPTWEGSPYPGLRAFTPHEAPIFFGRERQVEALLKRLRDPACRFLAISGAGGSGKSSLLSAGLLPRLMTGEVPGSQDWLYVRVVPGKIDGNPFLALATRLRPLLEQPGWQQPVDLAEKLADDLLLNPDALREMCHEALASRRESAELLLFIDQFEELFTIVDGPYREPFIHLLAYTATIKRMRIIIALHADFYAHSIEWPPLAMLLQNGTYPLAVPDRETLWEMITRPADRAGWEFEAVLDHRILKDTGPEPGDLALMAFTLHELYHACQSYGDQCLRHAAYDELGGVQGAVARRAQAALDDTTRAALPHVLQELVAVNEHGASLRYVPVSRVTDTPLNARLINALLDARLLGQSSGRDNEPVVQIAHEVLFRHWPDLIAWIEVTQDNLRLLRKVRLAAKEWADNDRSSVFAWAGGRLQPVYAMLERLQPELNATERDFVKPELEQLVDELDDPATPHARRLQIGERLAALGDTRPGVGLQPDGWPDIVWCHVPGGEVILEGESQPHTVESFYIAKYLITYIQFQTFIEAEDGFADDRWWDNLAGRAAKPGTQHWLLPNHPRENISWYDAVAFCRWLSAKRGYKIRLPTEWEWQQAATGGDPANSYPWGKEWMPAFANTSESKLGRTTAAGMYPQGASPVGALDMCGNVWEWCLNERSIQGSTGLGGHIRRVARGGAWGFHLVFAQTTSRDWPDPTYRFNILGFRVACSFPVADPPDY